MLDGKPDCSATLLVVDDEPAIRSSISQVLVSIGYHVRSAEDGFSALIEIENEIPDIILSDLNMPGMSGFELLLVVRNRYPSIRAIAMSGTFSGDEASSGIAANAFYQKGCGAGSLLKIISACRGRTQNRVPVLRTYLDSDQGTQVFHTSCKPCMTNAFTERSL